MEDTNRDKGYKPPERIIVPTKEQWNYSYKPTEAVLAKFDGINARCGKCNHKLGEFLKADGEIKCKCGVKNKVKI